MNANILAPLFLVLLLIEQTIILDDVHAGTKSLLRQLRQADSSGDSSSASDSSSRDSSSSSDNGSSAREDTSVPVTRDDTSSAVSSTDTTSATTSTDTSSATTSTDSSSATASGASTDRSRSQLSDQGYLPTSQETTQQSARDMSGNTNSGFTATATSGTSNFCSDCTTPIKEGTRYNADTNTYDPASNGNRYGAYVRSDINGATISTDDTFGSGNSNRNGNTGVSLGGGAGAAVNLFNQFSGK